MKGRERRRGAHENRKETRRRHTRRTKEGKYANEKLKDKEKGLDRYAKRAESGKEGEYKTGSRNKWGTFTNMNIGISGCEGSSPTKKQDTQAAMTG